jgi:hypothetical protein
MTTLTQDVPEGNRKPSNSDAVIVAEWPINKRGETARVSLERFNGVWRLNSRKWFQAEDGERRPTKQGIAVNIKYLPQFAEAVVEALAIARVRGLVVDDPGRAGGK